MTVSKFLKDFISNCWNGYFRTSETLIVIMYQFEPVTNECNAFIQMVY